MTRSWRAATSWDEVCRRAAGRTRYNAQRGRDRDRRRRLIVRWLLAHGYYWGCQAQLAHELGVKECTISRDMAFLSLEEGPDLDSFTLRWEGQTVGVRSVRTQKKKRARSYKTIHLKKRPKAAPNILFVGAAVADPPGSSSPVFTFSTPTW